MPRRTFLGLVPALGAFTMSSITGSSPAPPEEGSVHPGFPSQDPALVAEMVGASHARLDRVKELLAQSPALVTATWDWGFGDWETALGAASHTGRRDIAEVLIAHGARPDIFTFAMLGKLAAVKAMIEAQPGIQQIRGPHSISLLSHARAGGDDAKEVYDYLMALGDADPKPVSLEISDADKALFIGTYSFGPGPNGVLTVKANSQGAMMLSRGTRSLLIRRVEPHAFAPAGAPSVRLRFEITGGKAASLTVHDPTPLVKAVRVAD